MVIPHNKKAAKHIKNAINKRWIKVNLLTTINSKLTIVLSNILLITSNTNMS